MAKLVRIALTSLACGVLYALAFPPFEISLLAWVALVPLLLLIPGNHTKLLFITPPHLPSVKRGEEISLPLLGQGEIPLRLPSSWQDAAFAGFLFGLCSNLILFSWLGPTFHAAGQPTWMMLTSLFSLSIVLALYPTIFFAFLSKIPATASRPLWGAAAWVALEFIRGHVLTGFPWVLLAHSQVYRTTLLQVASITGEEGVSFIVVAFNIALATYLAQRPFQKNPLKTRAGRTVLTVFLVIGILCGWGRLRVRSFSKGESPLMRVALLQGNIDQYQKWNAAFEKSIMDRYTELAFAAGASHPDLIVWPESAVPGWVPNDAPYTQWICQLASATNIPHIVGAVSRLGDKDYNAAFLVTADGNISGFYAKRHLVPFGEFVPFGGFLSRVIPYLGQIGTFNAGDENTLFMVKDASVAPTICYEMMFGGEIRERVRAGATMIVNVTNDGWYLNTGAPAQHFAANIFRAIETGRPVLRAANTGISAAIDATGVVISKSKLLHREVLIANISQETLSTFFLAFGPVFAWLCLLLFAFKIFMLVLPKNRKNSI